MTDAEAHVSLVMSNRRRKQLRVGLFALAPLVLIVAGLYFYATGGRYVTTDNAYVRSGLVSVAATVSGSVEEVYVVENQVVNIGDPLFQLGTRTASIRLAEAEAELAQARLDVASLKAALQQKRAELATAEEDVAYREREFERHEKLLATNAVARSRHDEKRHDLDASRNRLATAKSEIEMTLAELGGREDIDPDRHPKVMAAIAHRDRLARDIENATVTSKVRGVVARINLQPGEYVNRGEPVFAMMATDKTWIEANLKETDLTHVRPGQHASLVVEAYPDCDIDARVASISPAAGSEYSVLPAQNATGNWVKITQRVPVRLETETTCEGMPLRAGMSVYVSIDTERVRGWPF